jgi:hypothetical protein
MSEQNKIVAPILYVCSNPKCDYSLGHVGVDANGKVRIVMVKTRKGNDKPQLASPPYGVVSAKVGEKAICPVCGGVCTEVENGRHKFLRLNTQRINAVAEKMRLIGNTMKGAQYEPTTDDLVKVQKFLYAQFDTVNDLIDKRAEKISNPGVRAAGKAHQVKVKVPFTL